MDVGDCGDGGGGVVMDMADTLVGDSSGSQW